MRAPGLLAGSVSQRRQGHPGHAARTVQTHKGYVAASSYCGKGKAPGFTRG
jgi:hypothetical protein